MFTDSYTCSLLAGRAAFRKLAATRTEVRRQVPTPGQIRAGNYPKLHYRLSGMDISIENPKGSYRRGVAEDGKSWKTLMKSDYGYIRGTTARDGDHVDVFVSDKARRSAPKVVHIVDQVVPGTKVFDEHKCMIGWDTIKDAKKAYLENYEKGWDGFGTITAVTMDDFKKWLKTRDVKRPYSRVGILLK